MIRATTKRKDRESEEEIDVREDSKGKKERDEKWQMLIYRGSGAAIFRQDPARAGWAIAAIK